jgi:hypothetical protein
VDRLLCEGKETGHIGEDLVTNITKQITTYYLMKRKEGGNGKKPFLED